jgi:SNF2 family DNA or RNA helicase
LFLQVKFDQFVEQGRVLHNYASILELLLRLRQCCDHPFLVMRLVKLVKNFSIMLLSKGISKYCTLHIGSFSNTSNLVNRVKRKVISIGE